MRFWAIIALALAGCASSQNPHRQIKPAESSIEPTTGTVAAQAATVNALNNALDKDSDVTSALKAMFSVSRVAIDEGKARSVQLTNEKAVSTVTKVAAVGLGLSFLAFVFGHYVRVSKPAAVASAGLCLGVAVSAPALIEALGTEASKWIIISCFAILGLALTLSAAWLLIDKAQDIARKSR